MGFLTNWLFWIIVFSIVFILALIGYLTESRKKNEKQQTNNSETSVPGTPEVNVADNSNVTSPSDIGATLNLDNGTWSSSTVPSADSVKQLSNDDWTVMPTVEPAQPVVEQAPAVEPVQPVVEQALAAEPVQPVVEQVPAAEPVQPVVEQVPAVEPVQPAATTINSAASVQAPSQDSTVETSDIWK